MSVFWPVGLGWNGLFHVFLFVFMMTLADSQLPLQRFEGLVLERFADCIDGQVERFLAEIFV